MRSWLRCGPSTSWTEKDIAVDWFAKICNRYQELQEHDAEMDEDDLIIVEIAETLAAKKCLLFQPIPKPAGS